MAGRKPVNEIGNRHGRLVVIERAGSTRDGLAAWRCQCDCGNETIVSGHHLRRGNTRSCGCLRDSLFLANGEVNRKKLPPGEEAFRRALRSMKDHAERRGYIWELSDEEATSLMASSCHYCGSPPSNVCKSRFENGDHCYNGIDRKDNSAGYIFANVVPCCFECNKAKGTRNEDEFLSWIDRIITFGRERRPSRLTI